ncbi:MULTISPECIES: hypothetical protein [Streptomyces]|uniref:hypothetical protein n=1 Tax=Streptomyces TaxID=1883 RepID=UPI00211D4BF0|nr:MULTISPECIES: hypothetical protein [unclassified Streptomyces]WTE30277.1 hypothetical protein OHB50_33750 [Streptomyces anulatus]
MYELVLRVDAGSTASAEQVDRQVSSLHRDLKAMGLLRVERKQAPAPEGSMASAGYELGALVLTGAFSAAALKAVSNVLVAFVQRSKARSLDWEFDGDKGTFRALSAKDQSRLVEVVATRIAAAGGGAGGTGESGGPDGGTPNRAAGRD